MAKLRFALFALPALLALAACEDPAKEAPKATVNTAGATAHTGGAVTPAHTGGAAAPAGAETVALDPATSTVGFVGSKVTGKHEGKFEKVSGSISLVGGKPEGGKITIEVDVASLKSDQEKLDGHLKSPTSSTSPSSPRRPSPRPTSRPAATRAPPTPSPATSSSTARRRASRSPRPSP